MFLLFSGQAVKNIDCYIKVAHIVCSCCFIQMNNELVV